MEEGITGDAFYIVTSGTATVSTRVKGELTVIGAGEHFGEMALVRAEPCAATLRVFELAVLAVSGYGPDFSVCVGCSSELRAFDRGAWLHVAGGGLLCSHCVGPEASGILLGPESVDCLHRLTGLVAGGLPNATRDTFCGISLFSVDEHLEIDSARHRVASELRMAVAALIEPHLRSPLRSLDLMSGI